MTFGEKLFKLRKEKGFSQETLAEQIGTTRQAVSKWENNQGFPETEKLLQISDIFEISLDFLLKDEQSSDERKAGLVRIPFLCVFGIRSRTFRILLLCRSHGRL